MRYKQKPIDILKNNWFTVAILICIILASFFPNLGEKNGPLQPEITVKYGAVSLIFFLSGLSLRSDHFLSTFKQYKLHIFIQTFTFCLIPALVHILVRLLANLNIINGWILKGLLTVSVLPPSVSSAVVLTRGAAGNETAAIFNSILGSFLGIFITPLLLLINLGWTTLIPMSSTIIELSKTVLAPLILGQIARKVPPIYYYTKNLPLNIIGQLALLLVIFTAFCETFISKDFYLGAVDILFTIFMVLMVQIGLLWISFALATSLDWMFTSEDIVAIVFCCTHKSLTLGVPLLRIIFHGFSHFGPITLPLLVYHPTQIILGGLLVTNLKQWVMKNNKLKHLPL